MCSAFPARIEELDGWMLSTYILETNVFKYE